MIKCIRYKKKTKIVNYGQAIFFILICPKQESNHVEQSKLKQ
jgi:hypothetical protein